MRFRRRQKEEKQKPYGWGGRAGRGSFKMFCSWEYSCGAVRLLRSTVNAEIAGPRSRMPALRWHARKYCRHVCSTAGHSGANRMSKTRTWNDMLCSAKTAPHSCRYLFRGGEAFPAPAMQEPLWGSSSTQHVRSASSA